MDVFSNVLEGTRQYFLGLPKQASGEGVGRGGGGGWAPTDEPAPAQSGAPTPTAPPPSAAAAPPPPRPPSEPLEPEPHIIHKATVMREAAEKRREQPEPDEDEVAATLSPPPHIIRRPGPEPPAHTPPAAPPRPPSQAAAEGGARGPTPLGRSGTPAVRPPEHFTPARPPDPYSSSRPPEPHPLRYYESHPVPAPTDGTRPGRTLQSPQPPPRHGSPQTYARLSSTMPAHAARMRDGAPGPPGPPGRYVLPTALPHNDRVPPIHHPHAPPPGTLAASSRAPPPDARLTQYPVPSRHELSPYGRSTQYERHPTLPQRKYDPQQAYPGYRPSPAAPQPVPSHRIEPHHALHYQHAPSETLSVHYPPRPLERVPAPQHAYQHETIRRAEYPSVSRTAVDTRSGYHGPTPSTSSARYASATPLAPAPGPPPAAAPAPPRQVPRPAAAPKSNYELPTSNHVQTSPARSTVKPGYPNQQARMTVSVTSLVNQMNQTKQKRESPLDLSVKTVKNSADSSTTQDDVIDSGSAEHKVVPLQPRPSSSSRHLPVAPGFGESHKVDFAPDFSQYRERTSSQSFPTPATAASAPPPGHGHHSVRYNGTFDTRRPPAEHPVESRHHLYPDRSKYSVSGARSEYVPRIDLTRSAGEEHRRENRIRDDRHFIIEERKRPPAPIVSNIPEKIVRYETWSADSRIDRMTQSAREQRELMSQPVYSYSSHKQYEAYQNEQKRLAAASAYRDHHHHNHINHRYAYPPEVPPRERHDYHAHHHERSPSIPSRQVIQKIPSHRDIHPHHIDPHSSIPADKRVLSILRNSLETKQTGFVEPPRQAKHIPDLIVIDDEHDSVIEITDLTKDNDVDSAPPKPVTRPLYPHGLAMVHHIQMPKAVDSFDNSDSKSPPENDVASRIRTKAEMKALPPSETSMRHDLKLDEPVKILPKSQKQHLFNQIREDQILEFVTKSEKNPGGSIAEVKSEPINIEEIEKDAVMLLKIENVDEILPTENMVSPRLDTPEPDDLDWASACDNFMEQLKIGVHKQKSQRKRVDTIDRDHENKATKISKVEPGDSSSEKLDRPKEESLIIAEPPVIIKQEPVDEEEVTKTIEPSTSCIPLSETEVKPGVSTEKIDMSEEDSKKDEKKPTRENKLAKKKNNEKESPLKNKKLLNTLDKDNSKVKKNSTAEKSKVGRPKKSAPQEEKDLTNKITVSKDDTDPVPSKVKKSSIRLKSSDTEIRKCRQNGVVDSDTDTERQKNKDKREAKLDIKGKRKCSKTRQSGQSESEAEKDKRKPRKPGQSDADDCEAEKDKAKSSELSESPRKVKKITLRGEKNKILRKCSRVDVKLLKEKGPQNNAKKSDKHEESTAAVTVKKEVEVTKPLVSKIKEEPESTDDDEPLIKSKLQKEKEIKYQLLKDLSEKSAYVKLECFGVDLNKNARISIDSLNKEKEKTDDKEIKGKSIKHLSKTKDKGRPKILNDDDTTSCSDDEDIIVATRLRTRKGTKTKEKDSKSITPKTPAKASPKKQDINASITVSPLRKPGFGDGSDFRPGWEEELYKYKRSLRMPTRLIAIPRGRSGGPFVRGASGSNYNRGSTSLPDLDPAPLSPAPSSAPSAATDDLYARRQDKLANIDSDLESNSSCSVNNRLQYDSEASTSTVFSSVTKKKGSSIVDVLIQKCGKHDTKKRNKEKEDKTPKVMPKSANTNELLPTPSLGLLKNGNKGNLSAKKEKLMEDIFYLGAFRKETVNTYRNAFIKNTDGLIGATEEFSPVVLKSRTRTESRVLKQRATIKEVFGDERPASAPPTSCREEEELRELDTQEHEDKPLAEIKKDKEPEPKPKLKSKKIIKDKFKRRSSSIRDGLRSTKSLKRNDAKGRLMRLKHRNSLMKSLASKRMRDLSGNKIKKEKPEDQTEVDKSKEEGVSPSTLEGTKRRFKRLFGRRKFSSGFDYIRKKKKMIRREETPNTKIRRPATKPSPESVHDIQKEIKGWFINKSVGETHLHRAARLGYTDCVAYCLEKMEAEPSAKDNAGFTPLHVAASKGHVRIARLLLQYGANVSAAANGGIRPLHEACENGHVEIIRLLLAYGADPLLGTYAGQTPEKLTEGPAALLLRLHIADVQGVAIEPWRFPPPGEIIDREELGCDPLSSPPPGSPPPPPDATIEMQCTEFPLPPFYTLKSAPGQPADGLWCLLQDITNLLQIKSKDSLLKQIHCGSGSPKELFRELRTQEFLERAQCHQLLCAGEKVNIRASKVALVRVTDKLRQLLKIETVLIS